MSIHARIDDAILLYENGRYEGAFLNALIAVASTARLIYPSHKIGDRVCFERFLSESQKGVIGVEFHGDIHTIPQIFYKWFRCELVHKGALPVDIEFIDSGGLSLRAGGAPEYILKISHGWIHWLIQTVTDAPCNKMTFQAKPILTKRI